MNLTTVTHVTLDGVMQGLGGPDEDRRGGCERGGWAWTRPTRTTPHLDVDLTPLCGDEKATERSSQAA